jgi:hypothetical protein
MDELAHARDFGADDRPYEAARAKARQALLGAVEGAHRRTRRRRAFAVLGALLAIAFLLSSAAFGLGSRLRELVEGQPPPPSIAEQLVKEATAKRLVPVFADTPNVNISKAHGAVVLETAASGVVLWTAPTRAGPLCYVVELVQLSHERGRPGGESLCMPGPSPGAPLLWTRTSAQIGGQRLAILHGAVADNVASVVLRGPDGTEQRGRVGEGFFLLEAPDGGNGSVLIARDKDGGEVGRSPVNDFLASIAKKRGGMQKVIGPERTIIDTKDSTGRPLRLSLRKVESGDTCMTVAARNGQSTGCGGSYPASDGIAVTPTLAGSMVYLSGSVGPEVKQLTLLFQDGTEIDLPIAERFVLYDIPRAHFTAEHRPTVLIGRDSAGKETARTEVGQTAFAENTSIWDTGEVSP